MTKGIDWVRFLWKDIGKSPSVCISRERLEELINDIDTLQTSLKNAIFTESEYCKELEAQNEQLHKGLNEEISKRLTVENACEEILRQLNDANKLLERMRK